jgi:diguanylate cyclase (GGDEF)-like protein
MSWDAAVLQAWFNAWLLRVGKVRVVLAITAVSVVLSVLMTWAGNVVFMPDVPVEEWLYISFIVPAIISPLVSSVVLSLVYQLAEAKAALVTMSETDPLTGVGNRRHFVNRARQALLDAVRLRTPLTIVLLDIDHFKRLNDTYGHAVGDDALVMVANVCRRGLRAHDVFCRWGGEEFIALLPSATLETGCLLAERLRTSVAEAAIEGVPPVTVSIGVAELSRGFETLDEVIANADRRLYMAKDAGRNRVEPKDVSGKSAAA